MNIKPTLENALKDAMRARDEARKRTIRMAMTTIRLAEVDKGSELEEAGILAILHKEIKSRRESIADAERAGRPEMVAEAQVEIAILEEFLPAPLTSEELETLASQTIVEVGATSIKEMGQVMKILVPRLEGKVTGDQASQVVRRLLG